MDAFLEHVASLELRIIQCQPIPSRWDHFHASYSALSWSRYPFDRGAHSSIPQNPGFYCFFVGHPPFSLPQVGYPMYLGKTERTLRERFGEYLTEQGDPNGRVHVRKFLRVFEGELSFVCTLFDGSHEQVRAIETSLLDALMPAYSDSGYSAEVRAGKGAWQ